MFHNGMRRADVAAVIGIVSVLAIILLPVFMRARQMQASRCQSNMSRIGKAFKMYLADWEETYPTQRLLPPMNTFIAPRIALSDPNKSGPGNESIRFENGVNWVEALYPYIESDEDGDAAGVWKCPSAGSQSADALHTKVTYSFNANLIEYPKESVRSPGLTMMVRELDRLECSLLKPAMKTHSSAPAPSNVFLNKTEPVSNPKYKLHGGGSHILFADGHVKCFTVDYYPGTCQWDNASAQWFNYVSNLPSADPRIKSIAVSP